MRETYFYPLCPNCGHSIHFTREGYPCCNYCQKEYFVDKRLLPLSYCEVCYTPLISSFQNTFENIPDLFCSNSRCPNYHLKYKIRQYTNLLIRPSIYTHEGNYIYTHNGETKYALCGRTTVYWKNKEFCNFIHNEVRNSFTFIFSHNQYFLDSFRISVFKNLMLPTNVEIVVGCE